MAPERRKRSFNATELLNRRSSGIADAGRIHRHNMRVFRTLLFQVILTPGNVTCLPNHRHLTNGVSILQENRNFVKVWSKCSKSPIMYESGKIYFENYLNCYSW